MSTRIENERSREDNEPDTSEKQAPAEIILFRPASAKRQQPQAMSEQSGPQDDGNDPGPSAA